VADQQPLRVGVIGIGWAGQQHMAAYAEAAEVDLVALAGMEPAQLAQLGDRYGVPPGSMCCRRNQSPRMR
jgi:predicted dehydrogenase